MSCQITGRENVAQLRSGARTKVHNGGNLGSPSSEQCQVNSLIEETLVHVELGPKPRSTKAEIWVRRAPEGFQFEVAASFLLEDARNVGSFNNWYMSTENIGFLGGPKIEGSRSDIQVGFDPQLRSDNKCRMVRKVGFAKFVGLCEEPCVGPTRFDFVVLSGTSGTVI